MTDDFAHTAPYQWTVEQVTKWASWTLDQFNLPGWYLSDLKIDGTALCLLSAKDFERRWPHCGEYLYAQLAVWKGGKHIYHCSTLLYHSVIVNFRGS